MGTKMTKGEFMLVVSCVNLAGSPFPDMWSKFTLDVSVRVFWMRFIIQIGGI